MNILLDLGAIKTGGGVQLALNFLQHISSRRRPGDHIYLLVAAGSLLEKEVRQDDYSGVWSSPATYVKRAVFEYATLQRLMHEARISVVFTFFGAGIPHPPGVTTIVTVAYPIICYPESAYWRYERPRRRLFNRARNWLRVKRLRKADRILVETDIMRERIIRTLNYPAQQVSLLPPAVSKFAEPVSPATRQGPVTLVVVSDNSNHKNIWRLPAIARHLHEAGVRDFRIVLTLTEGELRSTLQESPDDEVLALYFNFIGRVAPTKIMEIYGSADIMIQLSDLESFSNNYIEAWRVGLPMIASDRDFAHAICQDSALYVEPHDPVAAAAVFAHLISDAALRGQLATAGQQLLRRMPKLEERCEMIWEQISATAQE